MPSPERRPDRSAQRARQESAATSIFPSFRSPRTSTSAPATTARAGSTGPIGSIRRPSSQQRHQLQASLPKNWHARGPRRRCPFTTSSGGFTCTSGPHQHFKCLDDSVAAAPIQATFARATTPIQHALQWLLGQRADQHGTEVFCSGSSSCACPKDFSSIASPLQLHRQRQQQVMHRQSLHPQLDAARPNDTTIIRASLGSAPLSVPQPINGPPPIQRRRSEQLDAGYHQSDQPGPAASPTAPSRTTGPAFCRPVDVTTLFPANQYYENSTAYCDSSAQRRWSRSSP